MRKEFEMTPEQLDALMNASKSVPLIALQTGMPASPQENANNAWERLGKELGFDSMSVRPIPGKTSTFFTAEATDVSTDT